MNTVGIKNPLVINYSPFNPSARVNTSAKGYNKLHKSGRLPECEISH